VLLCLFYNTSDTAAVFVEPIRRTHNIESQPNQKAESLWLFVNNQNTEQLATTNNCSSVLFFFETPEKTTMAIPLIPYFSLISDLVTTQLQMGHIVAYKKSRQLIADSLFIVQNYDKSH